LDEIGIKEESVISKNTNYEKYLEKFTTKEFKLITWSSKRKDEKVGEKNREDVFNVYVSEVEWNRKHKPGQDLQL